MLMVIYKPLALTLNADQGYIAPLNVSAIASFRCNIIIKKFPEDKSPGI